MFSQFGRGREDSQRDPGFEVVSPPARHQAVRGDHHAHPYLHDHGVCGWRRAL